MTPHKEKMCDGSGKKKCWRCGGSKRMKEHLAGPKLTSPGWTECGHCNGLGTQPCPGCSACHPEKEKREDAGEEKDNRPEAVLDRVLQKTGVIPPRPSQEAKGTRFYRIWEHMKRRHKIKRFAHAVACERWQTFDNFFTDMHGAYAAHVKAHGERNTSIDRIDNAKGYSPENCRWATNTIQQNNRTNNRILVYKGKSDTSSNWAKKMGLKPTLIADRLFKGWSVEKALETPYVYHGPIRIVQKTLDGKIVKVWPSLGSAARHFTARGNSGNICAAIAGRYPHAYGFIWEKV